MSTRSGRTVQPTKRYRPEDSGNNNAVEDEFSDEPVVRRTRPTLRNLPESLAAGAKAQQETLGAILKEMNTHTVLMKKTLRSLMETQEAILDIHEALALVTKDVPAPQSSVPTTVVPVEEKII